jgi:hypothetical protein
MAIVQISKIIHRTGAELDVPQLDTGELGYSTNLGRLYIGNDQQLIPDVDHNGKYHTEILTSKSSIKFGQIDGAPLSTTLSLTNTEEGQLLATTITGSTISIINAGGTTGGKIKLGDTSNVSLAGGSAGYVLQTDGAGNLSWTTNGVLRSDIANVAQSNPAVVTTKTTNYITTGTQVTIIGVTGMTQLSTGGVGGTNRYYAKRITDTTFSLWDDAGTASSPVDSSVFFPATINTGYALGTVTPSGTNTPGGANTFVQFNDGGGFGGSSNLSYNKVSHTLSLTGTLNATTMSGNLTGRFNGTIGATTPNTAVFTTVLASTITANANGAGNNFKVGDDAYIGDINVTNTLRIKGGQDSANGYVVFGDADTASLGRSGTGPLTYTGNFQAANVTATSVHLNNWSLFANVNGVYATDGTHTFSVNMTQI